MSSPGKLGYSISLRTCLLALCALALDLQPAAAQVRINQNFSASELIGAGPGTTFSQPFEANAAAAEMSDPLDPDAVLEQQGFNAVKIFSRTCDCVPRTDDQMVRPCALVQYSPRCLTTYDIQSSFEHPASTSSCGRLQPQIMMRCSVLRVTAR